MLSVPVRKTIRRETAQAETQGDRHRTVAGVCEATGTLSPSQGKGNYKTKNKKKTRINNYAESMFWLWLHVKTRRINEMFHFKQILQIIHPVEEGADTLAFATEPVLASLANILAFQVIN